MKLLQQLKQHTKNGLLVILLGLFFILGSDGTGVPTITILGVNPAIVEQGAIYKDAGATAEDPEDGVVKVVTTGLELIDTVIPATYFVTYTATDQDSHKTEVKREVIVKASSAKIGIDEIMKDALLVERVKTQSTVDIQAVANLKSGGVVDGFATWTEYDNALQITKRYAINAKGDFYVGAEGDAETLLSVLTEKGISTIATWGYPVAKDDIVHPFIQPDIRSNSLASSLYENFRDFMDTADVVTSSNNIKLVYAKPYGKKYGRAALNFEDLEFGLQNKMGASIKVLTSVLNMRQMDTRWACSGCPFNGKAFKEGASAEIHHVLNKKWNPKATDETDGSGTRSFNLQVTGKKMFYAAQVDGDNRNSGELSIDNNVVESFSNWDADQHIYTQAGHTPSSVKMELRNNWSVAQASFRLAVLEGDIKFSNMAQTPVTGMSKNPSPLLLTIKTGWNIVKAKSKEGSLQFKRTSQKVAYGSDYNQACINEFGSDWTLADWNDLKRYFSSGKDMKTLVSRLGLDAGNDSAWVTKDGDNSYSSSRDYYMSYHNHQKPSHYLAHENIDNYFLSLGSWYSPQYSLCIKKSNNLSNGLVAHYPFTGNAKDVSGNNNHGVTNGGIKLTTDRFGNLNQAYEFNGVDSYISVLDSTTTHLSEFSLCAWFYYEDLNLRGRLIEKGESNSYWLFLENNRIKTGFYSNGHIDLLSSTVESLSWKFTCGIYDGNELKVYIDGELNNIKHINIAPDNNNEPIIIGWKHNGVKSDHFKGKIDDIRIYNRAISSDEVKLLEVPYQLESP